MTVPLSLPSVYLDERWAGAERLLEDFESAWQTQSPPSIDAFLAQLPSTPGSEDPVRDKLLEELVKIDLENRWRCSEAIPADALGRQPRLEVYTKWCPGLGAPDRLSPELIAEEYRVRHRWGDQPRPAEYARRFPHAGATLAALLAESADRMVREFAGRTPVRAPSPTSAPANGKEAPVATAADFVDLLGQHALLDSGQFAVVSSDLQRRFTDARSLAKELLQRGWLTPYQVNRVFQGRGQGLTLGPYVLEERLGEGGTGRVFKARHQKMRRLVALKLIREELLADPAVVRRFYREIQVVSRLDHPHVVHAFDAGPIGDIHVLVMEYVEGTSLSRLVKDHGPVNVAAACDYVRQAALGLQHAHERGLVHRDVKPGNLMLDVRQVVKVADLGLARCRPVPDAEMTGSLTPTGPLIMGTLDYMAPEQALDFHAADIRADIYSLGCTLYFLLTGQPPFTGGTVAQKLLQHQQREPPPVESIRPDVSSAVAAALGRMLAKRPEDRYQTPAETAAALAAVERAGNDGPPVLAEPTPAPSANGNHFSATVHVGPPDRALTPLAVAVAVPVTDLPRSRSRLWPMAAAIPGAVVAVVLVVVAWPRGGGPTAAVPKPTVSAKPTVPAVPTVSQLPAPRPNTVFEDFNYDDPHRRWFDFRTDWDKPMPSRLQVTFAAPGKVGKHALKVEYEVRPSNVVGIQRFFTDEPQDWSGYESLEFWFHGNGVRSSIDLILWQGEQGALGTLVWGFSDDAAGWRRVRASLRGFTYLAPKVPKPGEIGTFDWHRVSAVIFRINKGAGTFLLDDLELVPGTPRQERR